MEEEQDGSLAGISHGPDYHQEQDRNSIGKRPARQRSRKEEEDVKVHMQDARRSDPEAVSSLLASNSTEEMFWHKLRRCYPP